MKDDASFDDGMPRLTSNTTRMTVYTVETQVVQSSQRMKREGGKKEKEKEKAARLSDLRTLFPPKNHVQYMNLYRARKTIHQMDIV